jgi:hypothetical protein
VLGVEAVLLPNRPPDVEVVVAGAADLSPKLNEGAAALSKENADALFFDGDSEVLVPKMLLAVLGSAVVGAVVVDPAVLVPKLNVDAEVVVAVVFPPNPDKPKIDLPSEGLPKLKAGAVLAVDVVDAPAAAGVEVPKAADPKGDAGLEAAPNKLAKNKTSRC